MTNEEETVLMIKGLIASLPPAESEACLELAEFFRQNIKKAGTVGPLAIALVGAELQKEAS